MSCMQLSVEEEYNFCHEQSRLVVSERFSLPKISADAEYCFPCLSYTMSVERPDDADPSSSTIPAQPW